MADSGDGISGGREADVPATSTEKDAPALEESPQVWNELDPDMIRTLSSFGLEARIDKYKGRCVHATRTFQPGEVILKQDALALTLFSNEQGASVRCHVCLKLSNNLRRCSRCKYAHYCCEEHQRQAWKTHAKECKRLEAFSAAGRQPTPMVLVLSRVLDSQEREAAGKEDTPAGRRHADLTTLASHYGEHPQESMIGFANLAQVLLRYMGWIDPNTGEQAGGKDEAPSMQALVEGFCRLACNCHSITDADLRPFGIGCFPLAALVNHSCRPNAVQTYKGQGIAFRAMERVEAGDEVTISYVDVASPSGARSRELSSRYLFKCQCRLCQAPESEDERVKEATLGDEAACRAAQREAAAAKAAVKDKTRASGELLAMLTAAIHTAQASMHPLNVELMRLREHAIRLAVEEQQWALALEHCEASIPAYRRHYPAGSPVLGMQLIMHGKLLSHVDRHAEARPQLSEGLEIVRKAYGGESEAVQEGERLLQEAQWTVQGLGRSE